MKPTTVTTCDDNVPHPVLFMDPQLLNDALFDHYKMVWKEVEAGDDMPETWKEIETSLSERDLLRDRHKAHIHAHALF